MNRRILILIGWCLFGVIFVGFFAIMLIAVFSGDGLTPIKLVPGGRGGRWLPVTAIPVLIALIVVLWFWLRRALGRRASGLPPNKALNPDAQKRRAG